MTQISKPTVIKIFKALAKEENLFINSEGDFFLLELLNEIWDLRSMPSSDERYKTAYEDINKHMVLNDDWTYDHLFWQVLDIFKNNKYLDLLEALVSFKYRKDEDYINRLLLIINSFLEIDNLALAVDTFDENGNKVYKIKKLSELGTIELPDNKIPFFVIKNPKTRSYYRSSHDKPEVFPCFILTYNDSWNDYVYWTEYFLFFYNDEGHCQPIGSVKITDGESVHTNETMPEKFNSLPDNFVSLGQSYEYYELLKISLNDKFESALYALNDSAFYLDKYEKFENNQIFNTSLIRDNSVEKNRREVKLRLYGYDVDNFYNFRYHFSPKYAEASVQIAFEFNRLNELTNRIYAIIGKNGTGKTQLISSLPLDISKKRDGLFRPRTPMFSKVIAVSYSIYDNFEIPENSLSFNYVYCGLQKFVDGKKELLSLKEQIKRFDDTCHDIQEKGRTEQWMNVLSNCIDQVLIDQFVQLDTKKNQLTIDFANFLRIKDQLSSGQSILLFTISEIIANIRFDSLILFDEPETHLHPNAISQLMNSIHELVESFDSFCIIATHSPLIVQELLSNNVYILERQANIPLIRKIGMESFGENLTNITQEIFGNKEIDRQFEKIIINLIKKGKSYEDIIKLLESGNVPLSLNARLYIKSHLNNEEFEQF